MKTGRFLPHTLSHLLTEMFALGSYIISHATGTPFQTFITDHIISPLGLKWTTYNSSIAEQSGKLADGFLDTIDEWNADRKPVFKPVPFWNLLDNFDLSAGPGGVISNAKDLACILNYVAFSLMLTDFTSGDMVAGTLVIRKVSGYK